MAKIYVIAKDPSQLLPFVENGVTYPNRYLGQRNGVPKVDHVERSGIISKWISRGYIEILDEDQAKAKMAEFEKKLAEEKSLAKKMAQEESSKKTKPKDMPSPKEEGTT